MAVDAESSSSMANWKRRSRLLTTPFFMEGLGDSVCDPWISDRETGSWVGADDPPYLWVGSGGIRGLVPKIVNKLVVPFQKIITLVEMPILYSSEGGKKSTTTRQASLNRRPNRKHSSLLRVLLPRQQLSGLPRIFIPFTGGSTSQRGRLCSKRKWQARYGSLIYWQTGGTHYTQLDFRQRGQALRLDRAFLPSLNALATPILSISSPSFLSFHSFSILMFTQRLPLGSELHMGKECCCLRGLDHLHGPTFHSICGNFMIYKPSLTSDRLMFEHDESPKTANVPSNSRTSPSQCLAFRIRRTTRNSTMASWKAFQANLLIHIHVKPLQLILHTNHPPLKVMAKVFIDSALWKNSVVGNSVCSVTPGTLASPSLKIRSMKIGAVALNDYRSLDTPSHNLYCP
ncbi:hypothetical protein H5410_050491 [Solanum commersonii]|uniref:Uncharacterized protein n=1 Tax=Solanum commersonii TaxID=4109 RepID=A0A9J5WY13_SOLCO|nr:hypothetical protein H5410_050491 [Solanum commersonii]